MLNAPRFFCDVAGNLALGCSVFPSYSDGEASCVMAPRPNWKGYLKLSLVSCAVALFPATTTRDRVRPPAKRKKLKRAS